MMKSAFRVNILTPKEQLMQILRQIRNICPLGNKISSLIVIILSLPMSLP